MENIINFAVILLVSLTVVTVFAVLYYLVLALIFKKNDTADSMGHAVATGTIIMTLCVLAFSVYTQRQQSVSYDNGYSDAVADVKTITRGFVPERFRILSIWDYIDRFCETDDDISQFFKDIEDYMSKTDTLYYYITSSSPDKLQNIASNMRS